MANRRQILKYAGLGCATTVSTSLLGGCQGLSFGRVMVPIVVDKVFDIFIDFIKNLEIDYSQYFGSWYGGLRRNDRIYVDRIDKMLDQAEFNGPRTNVFKTPEGTCIYGVENQDRFNLCAPCYSPGTQVRTPMVEGNVLSGLLLASKSQRLKQLIRDSGTSPARVLVPVIAYQEPICSLYQSSDKPWRYSSSDGNTIFIAYQYNPSKNQGVVGISIPRFDFQKRGLVYLPS